tara:strand:- start:7045 stop:7890 length:846 start_codon:yes stop_codon:yes gene_type:complete
MKKIATQAATLAAFFEAHPRVVVITGAGVSAEAGIPTYRDASGTWLGSRPIQHQEFIAHSAQRQRYWARSMRGWPDVRDAQPGITHSALTLLQRAGAVPLIITQNVDRLHQRAGSSAVVDLHGRLDRVKCLDCDAQIPRESMQAELLLHNPVQEAPLAGARPDGDADVSDALVNQMHVPPCAQCGGILMPDVVFFGGTVPKQRVSYCMQALEHADALMAIGSSLQVFSGFRFCRQTHQQGRPLAIINPGQTRADDLATLKIAADCGPLLRRLAQHLGLPED